MTVSLNDIVSLVALIVSAYAIYTAIKETGASKMKTSTDNEALKKEVAELKTRIAVAESCNTKNDKAIGEIIVTLDWIKKGIEEIKERIPKGQS